RGGARVVVGTAAMKNLLPTALAALVLALAAAAACSKQPEPEKTADKPAATTTMSSAAADPHAPSAASSVQPATATPAAVSGSSGAATAAGPEDIAWDAPASWVSAPNPSTMRKATYKIPKAAGDAEDAELAVSSAGGGVDANIKRWEQQFGEG